MLSLEVLSMLLLAETVRLELPLGDASIVIWFGSNLESVFTMATKSGAEVAF